jgi:hypothetical protein
MRVAVLLIGALLTTGIVPVAAQAQTPGETRVWNGFMKLGMDRDTAWCYSQIIGQMLDQNEIGKAAAIVEVLKEFPEEQRDRIEKRIAETIIRYGLADAGDTFSQKYACPLFEPLAGCLVHGKAKPLPCIHHACYENENDLPPDELLDEAAAQVEKLNRRVYGDRPVRWLPLPIAVKTEEG